MKILVLGGCGNIGHIVVEKLIEKNHEVFIIDDLSTCLLDESTLNKPYYLPDEAKLINNNEFVPVDSIINLAMRYPLERERKLYELAFEGYVVNCYRHIVRQLDHRTGLNRVVCYFSDEINGRCIGNSLYHLLKYWHRPPNFGVYFIDNCYEINMKEKCIDKIIEKTIGKHSLNSIIKI